MSFFGVSKLFKPFDHKKYKEDQIHAILNKISIDHEMYDRVVACLHDESEEEPMMVGGEIMFFPKCETVPWRYD